MRALDRTYGLAIPLYLASVLLWRGRLRVVEDLGYIQDGSVAASDARIVNVWPALGGRAGPKKQQGNQPCKAVDNLHRIRTVIVVQPRQSHDC